MCASKMLLKMLLILPILSLTLFAKVQAVPVTPSDTPDNFALLNKMLQVVEEHKIKKLGQKFDDDKSSLLENIDNLNTKYRYLLSVLTGQQTLLSKKMVKVEEQIKQNQEVVMKNQEKLEQKQEVLKTNQEKIQQQHELIRTNQQDIKNTLSKIITNLDVHDAELKSHRSHSPEPIDLPTTTLNGKKYYFSYDQPHMAWSEADRFCKAHHMDLVSVESQKEWEALKPEVQKLIQKRSYSPWSSGRDIIQQGEWKWMATGMDISFYARSQLDNQNNDDCLFIDTEYWADFFCGAKITFICEVN